MSAANQEIIDRIVKPSREARDIRRCIERLTPEEIVMGADERGLCIKGSWLIIKDRLMRAAFRSGDPKSEVRWVPEEDERQEGMPVLTTNLVRQESVEELVEGSNGEKNVQQNAGSGRIIHPR